MAVIPEITCRRCGSKYSGLHSRCPKCGAPRVNQPTRVPPTTASVTPRTAASARSALNIRWQFVFGGVLFLALILAVVVLVASGKSGSSGNPGGNVNNTNPGSSAVSSNYISADLPTPSPSPEPTPAASPTPEIESMAIIWTVTNKTLPDKQMMLTRPGEIFDIDLDVRTLPAIDDPAVVWRSTNEKILTVNDRGFVNVVGADPGQTVHAGIIASYGGLEDYVTIFVPGSQAMYLTENLFDPDTYYEETREWDTFLWSSPSPRP